MSNTEADTEQMLGIIAQYTRDLSFENVNPISRLQNIHETQPKMDVKIRVNIDKEINSSTEHNVYNVSLLININASLGKPMFILDLDYCGEFVINGFPDELINPIVYIECPRLLFPFARSIIASAISEGGFPPFYLSPINFAELYQDQMESQGKTIQ
jgi:preprotein translocase subunit SecB